MSCGHEAYSYLFIDANFNDADIHYTNLLCIEWLLTISLPDIYPWESGRIYSPDWTCSSFHDHQHLSRCHYKMEYVNKMYACVLMLDSRSWSLVKRMHCWIQLNQATVKYRVEYVTLRVTSQPSASQCLCKQATYVHWNMNGEHVKSYHPTLSSCIEFCELTAQFQNSLLTNSNTYTKQLLKWMKSIVTYPIET